MQNIFVTLLSNYIDKKLPFSSKPSKQESRPKAKRSESQRPATATATSTEKCKTSIRRAASEPVVRSRNESRPRTYSRLSNNSNTSSTHHTTRHLDNLARKRSTDLTTRPGLNSWTIDRKQSRSLSSQGSGSQRSDSFASDRRPTSSHRDNHRSITRHNIQVF